MQFDCRNNTAMISFTEQSVSEHVCVRLKFRSDFNRLEFFSSSFFFSVFTFIMNAFMRKQWSYNNNIQNARRFWTHTAHLFWYRCEKRKWHRNISRTKISDKPYEYKILWKRIKASSDARVYLFIYFHQKKKTCGDRRSRSRLLSLCIMFISKTYNIIYVYYSYFVRSSYVPTCNGRDT